MFLIIYLRTILSGRSPYYFSSNNNSSTAKHVNNSTVVQKKNCVLKACTFRHYAPKNAYRHHNFKGHDNVLLPTND
jgi:hypothetical protein